MSGPEVSYLGALAVELGGTNEQLVALARQVPEGVRPLYWHAVRATDAGEHLATPRGLALSAPDVERLACRAVSS